MDELVKHCIKELAYEGELGCGVDSLKTFINQFWTQRGASSQTLDDNYLEFVWNALARYPGVCIGTVPEGAVDVIIALQNATKRLLIDDDSGEKEMVSSLDILSLDTNDRLVDLLTLYGTNLRIAVTSELVLKSISGSPVRPAKLTPMVYTCLQFISRARNHGITMVDVGAKTGYDQKTCFYLVKVLTEMNLVSKLKSPDITSNVLVHNHFLNKELPVLLLEPQDESEWSKRKKLKKRRAAKLEEISSLRESSLALQPSSQEDLLFQAIDPALLNEGRPNLPETTQPTELSLALPVPLNATMDRLILETIHRSGDKGSTLAGLQSNLGQFDRRSMELLINKGEQTIPPSHLRDLSLCDVLETSGKERRHKYFTLPAYEVGPASFSIDLMNRQQA